MYARRAGSRQAVELAINFAGGAATPWKKRPARPHASSALRRCACGRPRGSTRPRRACADRGRSAGLRAGRARPPFFKIKKPRDAQSSSRAAIAKGKPVTAYRFLFDGQRVDGERPPRTSTWRRHQIARLHLLRHDSACPSDSPRR